jgi:hypothetical protein
MPATAPLRRLLGRALAPGRAGIRHAKAAIRARSRATAIPVQITLDGRGVLNWRSAETTVQALLLESGRGTRPTTVPALAAAGPPHGVLPLAGLGSGPHTLRVRTSRGVRPVVLLPAGDGTRNETLGVEDGAWQLEDGPAARLVHRAASEVEPGLLALDAAHGLVALEVGPLSASWTLTLERRGGGQVLPVPPRPGPAGPVRTYRLGAAQWREAAPPPTAGTAVWDVALRRDEASGPRVRMAWRGSGIEDPRAALRLRAVVSHAVPGRRIEIRPYWTKDNRLALELTTAPSIGGAPA